MLNLTSRHFSTHNLLYIGLGEMGYHMSGYFSKHFPTTVWNRTASKSHRHHSEFNTNVLEGPNPFVHDISKIDLIFSCLPTSREVDQFADLLISSNPARKPDLVWVDNTSGVPGESQKIASKLESANVGFIDAPVSGGRVGASTGKLAVMVGGKTEHYLKAEPVLKTISKSLLHIDEKVGSGHAVKGYNNLLYGCNILLAMKVAQSLQEKGINVDKALRTIINASGGSFSMTRVLEYAVNDRKINYNFKTSLLVKDMLIGLDQIGAPEGDRVSEVFKKFVQIYKDGAKENWDEHDLFEIYGFIEKKPKI